MSYEDIRLIFERVWDQNHAFVPKDSETEKEVMKRPGFDFLQKSIKNNDKIKASGFVQKKPVEEEKEKKNDNTYWNCKFNADREEISSYSRNAFNDVKMPPKKTSTSATLTMTHTAIWQLIADSVAAALEA
ncbi:hypothetical protein Tco_0451329 [Tanacetum coccineum]